MATPSIADPKPAAAGRRKWGKAPRDRTTRMALAESRPSADHPDPVPWLKATNEGRLPQSAGIRGSRMPASPFAFLRGAADLMALDLLGMPTSGFLTSAIGDAHLANFGLYGRGNAERNFAVDVNDFDQAHPGPWEWDLMRLAASIVVAGRGNGISERMAQEAVRRSVARYALVVDRMAGLGPMARREEVITVQLLEQLLRHTSLAKETAAAEKEVRGRTQTDRIARFAGPEAGGRIGIIAEPPLLVVLESDNAEAVGASREAIVAALDEYVTTLPDA